jgi:NAD(P)-dependent dehydrogenase (short-subunit alcohol dehydrogenase family)
MKPLSGQTALITGAVRSIGRATEPELSELGEAIVINARPSRKEAQALQAKGIDLARMIAHLCLPASRYITGQSLHVSGGIFMP